MRKISSIVVALILGGCYATVSGEGQGSGGDAEFRVSLPVVLPPLVVVEPGFSVVRDLDEEVFYVDGYYWARQDHYWYRSSNHRSGWSRVEQRHVPARVAQAPPGRYRHYQGSGPPEHQDGHEQRDGRDGRDGHDRHDRRDDDQR